MRQRLKHLQKRLNKVTHRKCPRCGGRWGVACGVIPIVVCGKPWDYFAGGRCPTCGAKPPFVLEFVTPEWKHRREALEAQLAEGHGP